MKVIYSTEDGAYLDSKAAHIFFAPGNDFFEANTYESLFTKLEVDPNLFAVVPIDNSVSGESSIVLERLFTGKYKIFGEIFISPSFCLATKVKTKLQNIREVYIEPSFIELCHENFQEFEDKKVIKVQDIKSQVEKDDPSKERAYIVTNSLAKELNLWILRKNIGKHIAGALRYLIVGRTFFDMPDERSDKVIVLFRTDPSKDEDLVESILSKDGLTTFKVIKKDNPDQGIVDYYAEFGFYGLLDLQELELHSLFINILGIIESGELYSI